jgi:hypothetical protein
MRFLLFIPVVTPVSLLESEWWVRDCHAAHEHRTTTIFTSMVYGQDHEYFLWALLKTRSYFRQFLPIFILARYVEKVLTVCSCGDSVELSYSVSERGKINYCPKAKSVSWIKSAQEQEARQKAQTQLNNT